MSPLRLLLALVLCFVAFTAVMAIDVDTATEHVINMDADVQTPTTLKTDEVVQKEDESIVAESYNTEEQKIIEESSEKFTFQAEVNKLMNIIINSLYSKKEIFLRELISNASDALDKLRYLALTNPALLGDGEMANLDIRIKIDKTNRLLHIIDRGVGMTKDDLIKNLGTIAQSGTKEFIKKVTESENNASNLIGQFGVGFYSLFLVADNVVVTSKHHDDDQYIWQSTSDSSFSITKDPKGNTLGRGTRISLHIKDDSLEFLEQSTIQGLIKKYSQFINFPIYMYTYEMVDAPEEELPEENDGQSTPEDKPVVGEEEEADADAPEENLLETPKTKVKVYNWQEMNDHKPLWMRSPREVKKEEYDAFYKSLTKSTEEPLAYAHIAGEGDTEFKSLIFIPAEPPANMFDPEAIVEGIKLFVRRVFITDNLKDLVPNWLRFLKGIIDSDDLPLNVSREILQQHKILATIKKKIVKKFISMVQEISNKEEGLDEYYAFYKKYGNNLKFGVIEEAKDTRNKNALIKLLVFHSSKDEHTTFDNYVKRMKEGQKQIYYIAGKSKENLQASPLIEQAVKRGYEVLYMVDPIDEYLTAQITEFSSFKLTNLAREGVKFDAEEEEDKDAAKAIAEEFKPVTDFLQKTLGKKVEKVVVSSILADSPCALVSNQWGVTANMERIIKAQSFGNQGDQMEMMMNRKVMEINPEHTLIRQLLSRLNEFGATDEVAKVSAHVLYETSALSSGYVNENPASFANFIYKMMELSGDKLSQAKTFEQEPEVAAPVQVESADDTDYEEIEEPSTQTVHDEL
eukprot:gene7231-8405_t